MKNNLIPVHDPSEIPAFANEAEEAAFWNTHEITDELWDKLPTADLSVLPPQAARARWWKCSL